jgi:SAM-dependent methyltransferase
MRFADVMNNTWAYRVWQAPFANGKLQPFLANFSAESTSRVLDIGCGPGTSAPHFAGVDYTGLDINAGYIADATKRYARDFRVADVTQLHPGSVAPADVILVNSLLHHLDDAEVHRTLSAAHDLLTPDGRIHILDLVLPDHWSPARLLARLDRGAYARPIDAWARLFDTHFVRHEFMPYQFGGGLWAMVYFCGSRRS